MGGKAGVWVTGGTGIEGATGFKVVVGAGVVGLKVGDDGVGGSVLNTTTIGGFVGTGGKVGAGLADGEGVGRQEMSGVGACVL